MTLTETQVSYDRKHAAWAVRTSRRTLDRWVWDGVLHPTLHRSQGSGYGPHQFSVDDVRLAAMLAQFTLPGNTLGGLIRRLLSEAWYALGPSEYVVVTAGPTVTPAHSASEAVAIVNESRGVATVLWPDRMLGWA